jgi:hypothetical protein
MKNVLLIPVVLLLLIFALSAMAQTHEETIRKTVRLARTKEKKWVIIQNLKGWVTVEAYQGDAVGSGV